MLTPVSSGNVDGINGVSVEGGGNDEVGGRLAFEGEREVGNASAPDAEGPGSDEAAGAEAGASTTGGGIGAAPLAAIWSTYAWTPPLLSAPQQILPEATATFLLFASTLNFSSLWILFSLMTRGHYHPGKVHPGLFELLFNSSEMNHQ